MRSLRLFLEMIKFEHTVFALPFAYLGMLLAAEGWPTWYQFFWITVAMVSARTFAMSLNRLVDLPYDARNPRTAGRPLVTGALRPAVAWIAVFVSLSVFVLSAWMLGPLPFRLLPLALVFLAGYHYTKRFTWLSHFILGFTDGLAPMGAWVAVRNSLFTQEDLPAWLLLVIVTLWIAGFDLIYACQDVEVDRRDGLYSIPAQFGVAAALRLSSLCHVGMVLGLVALGFICALGWPYWVGLVLCSLLLVYEHSIVKPDDLSRVNVAFFNVNGYISLALFFSTLITLLWR
ncbi:MAG: UbiA-like polyprenyltransferase [Anaerolineae bacterium]|nr:putative 4-hydroxybenzoate polyprenyltransferase [Anaerolineae bacterium]MDW8102994.1 UbiA-like polyprenyltransferase [Anaerolineae bacterium]